MTPEEHRRPASSVAPAPHYWPELDVLRAFAFLSVFFMHWIPTRPVDYERHGFSPGVAGMLVATARAGGVGVMLFFCLSSFLITQLLLRELKREGRVDVGAFYMRRILRIWPLYFVFTAIAALLPFIDPDQHFGGKALLAFVFFGGNWIWSLHVAIHTVATPLWSISVEEQFYLCWPWVVRRSTRSSLMRTAFLLLVIATLNRVLVITGVVPTDLWHNTFTQLDSIALGALLAIAVDSRGVARNRSVRAPLILLAIVAIVMAQRVHGDNDSGAFSLVYYPLVSLCCATILWSVIGIDLDRSSRLTRALVYLGKISYGLYVIHSFALYLTDMLFAALPQMNFVVALALRGAFALALTIGLAALSYRFLEQPFLRLKKRWATDTRPSSEPEGARLSTP